MEGVPNLLAVFPSIIGVVPAHEFVSVQSTRISIFAMNTILPLRLFAYDANQDECVSIHFPQQVHFCGMTKGIKNVCSRHSVRGNLGTWMECESDSLSTNALDLGDQFDCDCCM